MSPKMPGRELQDSIPPPKATNKLAKTVSINFFKILESTIKRTTNRKMLNEERNLNFRKPVAQWLSG